MEEVKKELNYEQDVTIDGDILDVECLDQPMLVMKYSRISADADLTMDEEKEKLDLVKAELDNDIRTNPEKYDIAKITETVVTNTILMQSKYKKAMAAFLQAKHEANIVRGACKAVDHRKSMLETLVKLQGQQYFAGPKVPHDLTNEWEQKHKQKRADSKVKIKPLRTMRREE